MPWLYQLNPLALQLGLLLSTTLVMAWAGRHFYVRAWKGLTHRTADMNTLVAVGTLSAYLYSSAATFFPGFFRQAGVAPAARVAAPAQALPKRRSPGLKWVLAILGLLLLLVVCVVAIGSGASAVGGLWVANPTARAVKATQDTLQRTQDALNISTGIQATMDARQATSRAGQPTSQGTVSVVQVASHPLGSTGGQTAITVVLQKVEDGLSVQVGKQAWLGVAASLGTSVLSLWRSPFNLLGRLETSLRTSKTYNSVKIFGKQSIISPSLKGLLSNYPNDFEELFVNIATQLILSENQVVSPVGRLSEDHSPTLAKIVDL